MRWDRYLFIAPLAVAQALETWGASQGLDCYLQPLLSATGLPPYTHCWGSISLPVAQVERIRDRIQALGGTAIQWSRFGDVDAHSVAAVMGLRPDPRSPDGSIPDGH